MADAAITGGVEAGRGVSDGVRLSFTRVLGKSPSSSIFKENRDVKTSRERSAQEAEYSLDSQPVLGVTHYSFEYSDYFVL